MKKLIALLGVFVLVVAGNIGIAKKPLVADPCKLYGRVYIEKSRNLADYKVFIESSKAFADVLVFDMDVAGFADGPGLWHFTPNRAFADFTIYYEKEKGFSDFSIYFEKNQSFAGCNR